jgi:asparagine synthase (glutamine-hydrolysing)
MHNEDQTIWLVCNGEIYNYPSLRSRLEGLGHTFYSNSDNETILHAYEAWGKNALAYLEGMFAFALWDETRQTLLLARDRVGIKPLYHAASADNISFASEASALLPLLAARPAIEPAAFAYILTLGYVPAPWSVWQGVHKLEAGQILQWNARSGVQIERYWEPPRALDTRNDAEWQALFETVLEEHLLSDVPIGLFLSGGLDSSTVAAGLHDIGHTAKAITVSFPGSRDDEAPIAGAVAEHLGFPHATIPIERANASELIRRVAAAYDEPQGYSATLTMYRISQIAAREFKVVLAGDGGDENFGGYTWYSNLNSDIPWRSKWLRRALRPIVKRNASPATRTRAAHHFSNASLLHRHAWRVYPRFLPEEAEALFAPLGLRFNDETLLEPLRKHFVPGLPLRRALQRVDFMTFCSDHILAKVDRASMAHALEVRVPFLDRRVIEWALARPVSPRESTENRPLLRDYLASRVPEAVLNHPKQGFSMRTQEELDWGEGLEMIRQSIWVQQGMWDRKWERLVEPGVPYRNARIYILLMLASWADVRLN